jgi:oxygen-independent coproporphyrinogen-3 oxidase
MPGGDDMIEAQQEKTGVGNYFVANYPPFSAWSPGHLPAAVAALDRPPRPGTSLGLYLHVPFCRKRCKFCYFRVYTDKNAHDVELYLAALLSEIELYAKTTCLGERKLHTVYIGGGTPSYLSAAQLRRLLERVQTILPWDAAEEVTFECEPGTLQQHKLETLRQLGVTRLSLGVESFSDAILEANGRAHLSAEIFRAYDWARRLDFDQINIDLIAGLVGETWESWCAGVRQAIELAPESVTIYQLELPFNTVFSKELALVGRDESVPSMADWPTKHAWVAHAFDAFLEAGYVQASAYCVVRPKRRRAVPSVYLDNLWQGGDLFGTGVASFGHVNGVHMQNVETWEPYLARLDRGELPLYRALPLNDRQRLLREMILQLKTGQLEADYFRRNFGVDVGVEFADVYRELESQGFLTLSDQGVELTREGLLQIDRLLHRFFEPQYQNTRYT